ncbi:hypothetical protein ABWH96_13395 [Marivirga tractuosa]|uniref:hypothetical protein n=1 Tax=Marivirga tractuosa TaxID=1006 RepID=UPI0035CF09E2
MKTNVVKNTIHELIDRIEDEELLEIYMRLLQKEVSHTESSDFFQNTEQQLINRAKASIESIEKGRTIKISDFKTEIENWKKKRSTK